MKKYIIAGVLVVAVVAYLVFANKSSTPVVAVAPTGTLAAEPTSSPSAVGPTSLPPTSTAPAGNPPPGGISGSVAPTGQYKDGTYTGSVADAFYGNLQAVVTIQGGMITNVTFPQAPSGGTRAM
jgi:uncharacterized protein with FMN-binding domain